MHKWWMPAILILCMGAKAELEAPAERLSWSADARYVVATSRTGTLRLDAKGKVKGALDEPVRNATLSPDGGSILGVRDETFVVIDPGSGSAERVPIGATDGKPVAMLQGPAGQLRVTKTVAHHKLKVGDEEAEPTKNFEHAWLAPDAPVYFVDTGYGVQVHHLTTGRLLRTLDAGTQGQRYVGGTLDDDGRLVFALHDDEGFRTWTPPEAPGPVWPVAPEAPKALSSDGAMVAVGTSDGIVLYATATGATLDTLKTKEPVLAVAFSPNDERVAASLADGQLVVEKVKEDPPPPVSREVVEIDAGRIVLDRLPEEPPPVLAPTTQLTLSGNTSRLRWAPAGSGLHGWVGDRLVRVDGKGNETLLNIGKVPRGKPYAWSPDGTLLAVALSDRVHVIDPAAGKRLAELATGLAHTQVDWQGAVLVLDAGQGKAQVWDPATGQAAGKPFVVSTDLLATFAVDPGGRWVATAGSQPQVIDLSVGQPMKGLDAHTGGVAALAWSPDGSRLATAGNDAVLVVWDTDSWEPIRQVEGAGAREVAFSPDGTQLATVTWKGGTVIDVASGELLHRLPFDGLLSSVSWSTIGLVVADNSGNVYLWR